MKDLIALNKSENPEANTEAGQQIL